MNTEQETTEDPKGDPKTEDPVKDPASSTGVSETEKALQAKLDEVNVELAKQKQQKREAVKEATDLRNKVRPPDGDEDFKTLYATEKDKAAKALNKVMQSDKRIALVNQLNKVGVRSDAVDAALALANQDKISWDENDGLDLTEVEHEVQVLKAKHKFLFEKVLSGKDGANAADGTANTKTLRRIEYDRLDLPERAKRIKEGYKVVD